MSLINHLVARRFSYSLITIGILSAVLSGVLSPKAEAEAETMIGPPGFSVFTPPSVGSLTIDDILTITPKASAPATCSIGDFYVDTSGAACACTATNTFSNMTGTGTCV